VDFVISKERIESIKKILFQPHLKILTVISKERIESLLTAFTGLTDALGDLEREN